MTTTSEYSVEAIFPATVRSRFTTVDGYRTHFLEAGRPDALPVVLIHGAACSIGWGVDRWYPIIGPLAETFRVFAVEELGHGHTDPPRDIADLAHTRVRADHVVAFIESLDIGPVDLVGQSQGGWIAAYITLVRPDLVRKLVLVDSASVAEVETANVSPETKMLPFYKNLYEPNSKVPKVDLKTREGIRTYLTEFCFDKSRITDAVLDNAERLSAIWNDRYIARHKKLWANGKLAGMQAREREYSVNGRHISASVPDIARPTLVVWGKQSNKGVDAGLTLYKTIPDAEMHIFDRANHFVWMDRPNAFTSLVTWFLTREETA